MKSPAYKIKNTKYGFTLIEMIVSIGIFMIVMLVATSAIFTVISANKKAQSLKLVMNNLDFALDSMVREIRVGSSYSCPGDACASGTPSTSFTFTSSDSGAPTITYQLSGTEIVEYNSAWDNGGISVPITASDIDISALNFYLVDGGTTQPRVLITITGTSGSGTGSSTFNIQTTVSERELATPPQ